MKKPSTTMKEVVNEIIEVDKIDNISFNRTFLSSLVKKINKDDKTKDLTFKTTPFFECSTVSSSEFTHQKHILKIIIYQLNNKNYAEVIIRPLNHIMFDSEEFLDKENLLLKECNHYEKKISKSKKLNAQKLIDSSISKAEIVLFYSFEVSVEFDLYFISFVSKMLRVLHIHKKPVITNESDFKSLYYILGKDYDDLPYNQLKDLINIMDIRLGSLTKESTELIELNYSF